MKQNSNVKKVCPYFVRNNATPIGTSDIFYVKLKNINNVSLLQTVAQQQNVQIVKQVPYMPLWYVLSIQNSSFDNSVVASNYFYETGNFDDVDPAFMFNFRANCVNDPMFNQQWGLYNSSNTAYDINACDAWTITRGAGIKVAVVDQGIDRSHSDLSANLHTLSFDAQSGTSPSRFIQGNTHGTHVAGLVGAERNNNLQVTGVAPEAKIIGVSHDLYISSTLSVELASGISWAKENGADIITNSWGDQGGYFYNQMHSTILENAITDAINNGRGGKGCVVTFSSGNKSLVMDYPAYFNDNILTVGSIMSNGSRSSFSGYGAKLDIVAPGTNILSTIPNNGTASYDGTSMACPHVAGVAALVLSVNPNLTGQQVRGIIESTAQKIGGYTYQTTLGHSSGTWNNEMGYGLVNAYAAVKKAFCYLSATQKTTITQNTVWNTPKWLGDTITVLNGATLTITDTVYCLANTKILVQPGGKLVVNGGILTAACAGAMWEGIIVLGDRNQPQTTATQGTVMLNNGAVIEHAVCAVSAAPTGYYNYDGGIIKAAHATFRNNWRAIEYCSYEDHNLSGTVIDNVGKFTNCTFIVDSNNHFAANGKTFKHHVTMWAVRGVTFEGCTFKDARSVQGRYGIYTEDAGYKIVNSCPNLSFLNIDCTCPPSNTIPCEFTNFQTAIQSENTGTARSVYIDQSNFYHNSIGVTLNAQNNYRLTRCKFPNTWQAGLISHNSSGYRIEENEFTGDDASVIGIMMNNSGTAENRIYKNSFHNLFKGIYVQGINGNNSTKTTPPCCPALAPKGLQFLCNDFRDNEYDINIPILTGYPPSDPTVRSVQGSVLSNADNIFENTAISHFYSDGSQEITYYHPLLAVSGYNTVPYNHSANVTLEVGDPNYCISTFCTPGNGYVTEKFVIFDSLEQYRSMQAQYDNLAAQLEQHPELMQEMLILSEAMSILSDHAISRILHDSIFYLNELKQWYDAVRTPIAKYALAEAYIYEQKFDQAEAVLNNIPQLFSFDDLEMKEHHNYMQFYHLKKQMLQSESNWTELSEQEITRLQAIAEATSGRSASMAKGVLCFFYDLCCEDKTEKGEGNIPNKNTPLAQKEQYALTVYPNPSRNEVTVSINNPLVNIIQIEMFDMFGRILFLETPSATLHTIDINRVSDGVYIMKVRLSNGNMEIRKVVKIQ